jgi:hypothetical protein
VDACREVRPELRGAFLMLCDAPEKIVPLLPEADLCGAIRASGMSEGAWLLELATAEQRQACFDLDCWRSEQLEVGRVLEWVDALIEAGRPTLVSALREIDPELAVLALRGSASVAIVGRDEDPPDGFFTEDGVVYFGPRDDQSFARVREIAQATFSEDQPSYWRLVYGAVFEPSAELEEWALRWRRGRMVDLGFPQREQAMRAYRPLRVEDLEALPEPPSTRVEREGELVAAEPLPTEIAGTLLGQALRELPTGRAQDVLGSVLGVANSLAVADRLRLSEPDSIPAALRKAVRGIDRGLRELSAARRVAPSAALDRTQPLDLFRLGATLDPDLRPPAFSPEEIGELVGEDAEGEADD